MYKELRGAIVAGLHTHVDAWGRLEPRISKEDICAADDACREAYLSTKTATPSTVLDAQLVKNGDFMLK